MDGHIVHIQIAGLDSLGNTIVNSAIQLSQKFKCANVNTAHIFLEIVEKTSFKDILFKHKGIDYKNLYATFEMAVDNGDFGHSENDIYSMLRVGRFGFMSEPLATTLASITSDAFIHGEAIGYIQLLKEILKVRENYLQIILNVYNLTFEDIEEMLLNSCSIPSELEAFVSDMTTSDRVLSSTYVDTVKYTDEIVEVLGRKKKPNVLLVGKAGVGKTAVAEAFAQRIAAGDVPDFLQNVNICSVDGSLLTAGTRYRGDFEARVKALLDFAEEENVILFIDEMHSFVNAGSGSQGAETAGNMLKAKMNEGTIRVIGATTQKEFKKFIEKDDAFCRRLDTIEIKEPSFDDAVFIVEESKTDYENFHNVKIPDVVIHEAAKLSDKYLKADSFPDKIYTILDHASSSAKVKGEEVLTKDMIVQTVSKLANIPMNKLNKTDIKQLITLEDKLNTQVIGQTEAIDVVARAIRRGKSGISDSNRPLASFLFVGPTGVGKTELCKSLSQEVALGDMPMIRVDMSEFSDKISVNKMIGSAPGYVGYGEGGQLTEKVKHNPYSLILFDEIEKAHPDVFDIFLQILDDGRLSDSEGDTVDFTNCIIVMTSNAWVSNSKGIGFGTDSKTEDEKRRDTERRTMEDLEKTFKPEFLNRIDNVVLFNKLTEDKCEDITRLLLDKLKDRVLNEKHITLTFTDRLVTYITHRGYSEKYGARNIRREIQNTVEDALAIPLLQNVIKKNTVVEVDLNDDNEVYFVEV